QAITCIEQMWGSREFTQDLRIIRFFGGRRFEESFNGGVVVASINQLHYRLDFPNSLATRMLPKIGAIIIDEAHRASSNMYTKFLDKLTEKQGPDLCPICGLSATPGKAGLD